MHLPPQTFAIDCEDAAHPQEIVCDTQNDPIVSDSAIQQALSPSIDVQEPLAFRPFRNNRTVRADPYSSPEANAAANAIEVPVPALADEGESNL